MASSSSMSISSNLQAQETTHMYIPNASVGAVIGAKGSYIRDLNKYSGYSIKIASASDETNGYPTAVNAADRRVTIVGPTDRFWAVSIFLKNFYSQMIFLHFSRQIRSCQMRNQSSFPIFSVR